MMRWLAFLLLFPTLASAESLRYSGTLLLQSVEGTHGYLCESSVKFNTRVAKIRGGFVIKMKYGLYMRLRRQGGFYYGRIDFPPIYPSNSVCELTIQMNTNAFGPRRVGIGYAMDGACTDGVTSGTFYCGYSGTVRRR